MGLLLMGGGLIVLALCALYFVGAVLGYAIIGGVYVICALSVWLFAVIQHTYTQHKLACNREYQEKIEQEEYEAEIEREKEREYREQCKFNERHQIVTAVMSKVRELKGKYPMADEELFNEYRDKYNCTAMANLDKIEEKMKMQQASRNNVVVLPAPDDIIEDVSSMELLEEKRFKQIEIRLFKNQGYFTVQVETNDYDKSITFPDLLKATRMMVLLENDITEYNSMFSEDIPIPKSQLITNITHNRNKVNCA